MLSKFTYAKALLKRKLSKDSEVGKNICKLRKITKGCFSKHQTAHQGQRGLFADMCINCKKKTLKVKRKHQPPTKSITKTAENTLKEAANLRNDTKMTTAVTDIDLIAKEFQKYEKCYREYTRIVREEALQEEHVDEEFIRGNYEVVLYMVKDYILADKQCISMETLQSAYGVGVGFRQSRHKLEERLRKTFGDKILFLSHGYHSPKLVISKECPKTRTLSNTLQVSTFKRKYSQESSLHSERWGDEIYRRTSRNALAPNRRKFE